MTALAAAKARRYGWALLAPSFTLVSAFLMNAIASRRLGPAGFGAFAVASTLVTLLGIVLALGIPTTLVALAGHRAAADAAGAAGTGTLAEPTPAAGGVAIPAADWRAAGMAIVWCAGAVIFVVLVAAQQLLGDDVARWFPPGTAAGIAVASLGTALLEVTLADSQRVLAFRAYFMRMVGSSIARLAGVAVGVYLVTPTAASAVWGYAIATFASGALLAAPATGEAIAHARRGAERLWRTMANMLGQSVPVLGSSIVVAAMSWLDTLIIAGYMAPADVGIYAAAVRLTIVPATLIGGITSLALPLAVRAWREGTVASYNRRVLLAGLPAGALVVGALSIASGLLVRLVYGEAFAAVGPVFIVLVLGFLPNFACNPMSQVLFAAGRSRTLLAVQSVQLAATLLALAFLVGRADPFEIAVVRSVLNVIATIAIMLVVLAIGRMQPAGIAEPA